MKARALAFLSIALPLAAGCGGGSGEPPTARALEQHRFPVLRVDVGSGVDSLDPGIAYTSASWQSIWNVYLSPYGYAHTGGRSSTRIVPALAEGMPEISNGGRTYRFRLRDGLRYSNGKKVLAGDVAYAIRRLYLLDSPGAPLFDAISEASVAVARRGPIPGIESDDAERLVTIRLSRANASFLDALASPFAAPVPQSTPSRDRTRKPIPSTGPYRIAAVRWPKEFELLRNEFFEPSESIPETNPDRIAVSIVQDSGSALQRLIAGLSDYTTVPIHKRSLDRAERKKQVELRTRAGAGIHYFFMNTKVRPFSDIRVRQAVNYALDRAHLAEIFGDLAVPSENILPSVYPSYRRHDLYPYNIWRARALVRRAKAIGSSVTVFVPSDSPQARSAVEYLERQLDAIGLNPRPTRILPPASYWPKIGDSSTRAQIGYAYLIQRRPHPLCWFEPLLGNENIDGDEIRKLANTNYSFAEIETVDSVIEDLTGEPELTEDVMKRWADVDNLAMQSAPIAPFVELGGVDVFGPLVDVRRSSSSVVYGLDFGRVRLR